MADPRVGYERADGGVAVIRLDRPEARNALDTAMIEALLEHVAAAGDDGEVRALVLSSTDHLALSAGADVTEQLDEAGGVRRMELLTRLYDEWIALPKPTIAACHGACVGAGAELAVASDLRVGGSNLRMRFPGAALGIPVGPARLVTLCGLSVAKFLLLSGKEISADEALRWGLVHRVAPAAGAEEAAISLAQSAASQDPAATAQIKATLHAWDGFAERSVAEGRGQVDWQRSGPGLPHA